MVVPVQEITQHMRLYAQAQAALSRIAHELASLEANLKARFEKKSAPHMLKRAQASEHLQTIAFYYYDALFTEKKRFETDYGRIGFRMGKPKVIKKGNASWEDMIEQLAHQAPELIRTKKELNKARILALSEDEKADRLKDVGLAVVQDEYFYIQEK